MISKRLKSVADYLDVTDNVMDVGCDHALLSIYLYNRGISSIIASDVNENALKVAEKNIIRHGANIETRLSYGISSLSENDSVDTLAIAGMGALTCLSILDDNNIKYIKKLVIQVNKDVYLLRKEVSKKDFIIDMESIINESNKFYITICFKRGKKKYSFKDLYFGPKLRKNKNEIYRNYLNANLNKLENIVRKVPKYKFFYYLKLKFLIYITKKETK